jgi:hypothetical protein
MMTKLIPSGPRSLSTLRQAWSLEGFGGLKSENIVSSGGGNDARSHRGWVGGPYGCKFMALELAIGLRLYCCAHLFLLPFIIRE